MPRTMDTIIESVLNEDSNIPYTILVRAEFQDDVVIPPWNDNVFRVNLAGQPVYWDEDGLGEKEYLGSGELVSVSSFEEGIELQNYTLNLSITGLPVDPGLITDVKNAKYKNGSLIIYLAVLDKNYTVRYDTNAEDGPVVLFAGRMDTMTLSIGQTAQIDIQTSSRLADWERTRGGRYNRQTQGRYYDLSLDETAPFYRSNRDQGFDYVESLRQLELMWGGRKIGIGGGGGENYNSPSPYRAPGDYSWQYRIPSPPPGDSEFR